MKDYKRSLAFFSFQNPLTLQSFFLPWEYSLQTLLQVQATWTPKRAAVLFCKMRFAIY